MMRDTLAPRLLASVGLLLLSGLPAGAFAKQPMKTLDLELRESITVTGADYTLADVLVAGGAQGARRQGLHGTLLGRSPRPGYLAHITRTQIGARLEALSPGIHRAIRWKGASVVKVRSAGVALSGRRLVEVARQHLEQQLKQRFDHYAIAPVDSKRDFIVPKGEIALHASLGGKRRMGKRTCVWVDIEVGGAHHQTVPVWFDVESTATVWVLSEDRIKHDYVHPTGLHRAQRDVAALAEAPLGIDTALTGLRLTRPVAAGQVLTRSMVEAVPAVEKGRPVTVHAQAGRVRLRTQAIALADGEVAQRIRVRRQDRGESYTAVVVGRGEVAIDAD